MKKVLVVGLGKTGQSVLEYCEHKGWQAIAFDTRNVLPEQDKIQEKWPGLRLYLGHCPESLLSEVQELIVSPGVDLKHPIIQAALAIGLAIKGDIQLFVENVQTPIIAITGSNGKSTLTTLVTELINASGKRAQMAGNIGIPVLDLLKKNPPDYYVLELSSFQLALLENLNAYIAVVLNISPDHLDRHGTVEAYQASKERIYRHCQYPVINRNMHYQISFTNPISFGLDEPDKQNFGIVKNANGEYLARGTLRLLPMAEISPGLSGQHNIENALAALAIVSPLHLPLAPLLKVLRSFAGLPHRCQKVRTIRDVVWFNDSKGTNIGATQAAIEGLGKICQGKIILLAGGLGKGANFMELRPAVEKYVKHTIVFGEDAEKIAKALAGLSVHVVKDFHSVVELAHQLAKAGDFVLLSPACASLDMFKNFEHRGEVFVELVSLLQ